MEWSLDAIAFLRRHYGSWDNVRLSYALDQDVAAVIEKANELGLAKNKAAFVGTQKMPRWNPEQVERLRELYPTTTNSEIARELGRSVRSVSTLASRLKLKKTSDQLATMGRANRAMRRPSDPS